jgi:hypothetical protein
MNKEEFFKKLGIEVVTSSPGGQFIAHRKSNSSNQMKITKVQNVNLEDEEMEGMIATINLNGDNNVDTNNQDEIFRKDFQEQLRNGRKQRQELRNKKGLEQVIELLLKSIEDKTNSSEDPFIFFDLYRFLREQSSTSHNNTQNDNNDNNISKCEEKAKHFLNRGIELFKKFSLKDVILEFENAISEQPTNAHYRNCFALFLLKNENFNLQSSLKKKSMQHILKAIELNEEEAGRIHFIC